MKPPSPELAPMAGIRRPDARFTDGSTCQKYGKYAKGIPYICSTASSYSIFLCSRSCTALLARNCHSGGLLGSDLHRLQVEYTAFAISLISPPVRRAPLAARRPF